MNDYLKRNKNATITNIFILIIYTALISQLSGSYLSQKTVLSPILFWIIATTAIGTFLFKPNFSIPLSSLITFNIILLSFIMKESFHSLELSALIGFSVVNIFTSYFLAKYQQVSSKLNQYLEVSKMSQVQLAKNSALYEMSSLIAHEINGPLLVLTGNLAIIKAKLKAANLPNYEEFEKPIDKTIRATKKTTSIFKDILAVAKSDLDEINDDANFLASFELASNISNTRLEKYGIELFYKPEELNFNAYMSEGITAQVLVNLIGNSCHAIKNLPDKWIKVEVTQHPDHYKVYIIDSGQGIKFETTQRMFEAHYTTKNERGTGLGLPLSKTLLQECEAEIYYEIKDGHTCFVLKFLKTNNK